jgi:mannosyltransferase
MKLIYDDIIYSLQHSGGISLYWSQLEAYLKQDLRLLYKGHETNIFFKSLNNVEQVINNQYVPFERYRNIFLPGKAAFIFHSSYYRYCKNKKAVNITTVHDFIYEYYRYEMKSLAHKIQKKNAIYHSDGVIFVSENTKNDFHKLFPHYKGAEKVIYHGIVSDYNFLDIPKKNKIIFIGSRAKYKNFLYTVNLLQKLPQFKLQIIGGGPLSKVEITNLDRYIPNRYEYYLSLSNKELNIKYNEAFFLLYPSIYEGFGFPVIEAQAAGCPVVCCNTSSLPEVGGNAAIYISGKNIEEDLEKIEQLNDQVFYNNIMKKGFENCKRFSWEKCAKETHSFYQEVFDLKNSK